MGVPHHGNKEVEHKKGRNNSKSRVSDAIHKRQVHLVVGRSINDGEKQLKCAVECHGIAIKMAQFIGVFCLEDDVKCWQRKQKNMSSDSN